VQRDWHSQRRSSPSLELSKLFKRGSKSPKKKERGREATGRKKRGRRRRRRRKIARQRGYSGSHPTSTPIACFDGVSPFFSLSFSLSVLRFFLFFSLLLLNLSGKERLRKTTPITPKTRIEKKEEKGQKRKKEREKQKGNRISGKKLDCKERNRRAP
jgi:hypothetical protein